MNSPALVSSPRAGRVFDVIQSLPLGIMVEESTTSDDIARSGSLSHRADPEACLLAPSPFLLLSAGYLCRFSLQKNLLSLLLSRV